MKTPFYIFQALSLQSKNYLLRKSDSIKDRICHLSSSLNHLPHSNIARDCVEYCHACMYSKCPINMLHLPATAAGPASDICCVTTEKKILQ